MNNFCIFRSNCIGTIVLKTGNSSGSCHACGVCWSATSRTLGLGPTKVMERKALYLWPCSNAFTNTLASRLNVSLRRWTATSANFAPLFRIPTDTLVPEGETLMDLNLTDCGLTHFLFGATDQCWTLNLPPDRLRPILRSARNWWIRWWHISSAFYPSRRNRCLLSFLFRNGVNRLLRSSSAWKIRPGNGGKLSCPHTSTSTATDCST